MYRCPSYTEIPSFRNVLIDQRESSCCTLPDGKPKKNKNSLFDSRCSTRVHEGRRSVLNSSRGRKKQAAYHRILRAPGGKGLVCTRYVISCFATIDTRAVRIYGEGAGEGRTKIVPVHIARAAAVGGMEKTK